MNASKGSAARELRRNDFGLIGRATEAGAMAFAGTLPVRRNLRILEVGCGTGNCAIGCARRGGDVTAVDGREPHLSRARAWAKNEGLKVRFKQARYEKLPFSDRNFHLTLSFFGLHFVPRPAKALGELRRVTRPGGVIALTFWDPDGFMSHMYAAVSDVTGDAGFERALEWSKPESVRDRLADIARLDSLQTRNLTLSFPWSPEQVADCYLSYYTPLTRVFTALPQPERRQLRQTLIDLWCEFNDAGEGTQVESAYLELRALT